MGEATAPRAARADDFRVQWLDYSRGINILIVVSFHVYWGIINAHLAHPSDGFRLLFNSTAAMSLFFFISGSFIAKSVRQSPSDYLGQKLREIAWPYAVWILISSLLHTAAGRSVNSAFALADLWRCIYDPPWHFWFLYTLFLTHVLYFLARRAGVSTGWFLLLAFAFTMTRDLHLDLGGWGPMFLVRNYLFWFALGAWIDRGEPLRQLSRMSTPLALLVTVGGAVLAALASAYGARDHQWSWLLLILCAASAQMALCILLERFGLFAFITRWGQRSLEVYVAHVIFLAAMRIVLVRVAGIHDVLVHAVLGLLAGIYGPMLLHAVCERFGLQFLFSLKRGVIAARPAPGPLRVAAVAGTIPPVPLPPRGG